LLFVGQFVALTAVLWIPLPWPDEPAFLSLFLAIIVKHLLLVAAFECTRLSFAWLVLRPTPVLAAQSPSKSTKIIRPTLWLAFIISLSATLVGIQQLRGEVSATIFQLALFGFGCSALSQAATQKDRPVLAVALRMSFLTTLGAMPLLQFIGSFRIEPILVALGLASIPLPMLLFTKLNDRNFESIQKHHKLLLSSLLTPALIFSGLVIFEILPVQYFILTGTVLLILRRFELLQADQVLFKRRYKELARISVFLGLVGIIALKFAGTFMLGN
jgi:hypothetical protein